MFYRFAIATHLADREAVDRVAALTTKRRSRWSWRPVNAFSGRPFTGEVEGARFHIRRSSRRIGSRTLLVPILHGRIVPTPSGSEVAVHVVPTRWVIGVYATWAILLGAVALQTWIPPAGVVHRVWEPLLTFALALLLLAAELTVEARRARRLLEEALLWR